MITQPYYELGTLIKKVDVGFSNNGVISFNSVVSMGAMNVSSSFASYTNSNSRLNFLKDQQVLVEFDCYVNANHNHGVGSSVVNLQWRLEDQSSSVLAAVHTRKVSSGNNQVITNSFNSQAAIIPSSSGSAGFQVGSVPANSTANNEIAYASRMYFRKEMLAFQNDFWVLRMIGDAMGSGNMRVHITGEIRVTPLT